MVLDVSLVMTWILFIALFPMAFIWLRRAHRIIIKKDYSEVALKRGESPPNPAKFAPYTAAVNLLAGSVIVVTIFGVLGGYFYYQTWSSMAGMTLWMKIFADYIVSRQAHPFKFKKRKKKDAAEK